MRKSDGCPHCGKHGNTRIGELFACDHCGARWDANRDVILEPTPAPKAEKPKAKREKATRGEKRPASRRSR